MVDASNGITSLLMSWDNRPWMGRLETKKEVISTGTVPASIGQPRRQTDLQNKIKKKEEKSAKPRITPSAGLVGMEIRGGKQGHRRCTMLGRLEYWAALMHISLPKSR